MASIADNGFAAYLSVFRYMAEEWKSNQLNFKTHEFSVDIKRYIGLNKVINGILYNF